MAEIDPVILELIARNDRYVANLRSTTRIAEQSLGTQERRVVSLERQFARSGAAITRSLAGIAAGYASIATAREFLRLVDASKQIEAQLRLATRESGNFAQAQEDVRRIALSTRSSLEDTAQLYSVFQRTALQLGITQEQSARATETVTKSFQISGATAAEAAGGLRQFLQGLQSGALRGEELNSVLENAPRLAKLLADSLGVTVGQLRAMGQEGDLAAEKLISALTDRKFTDQIDAEFRELPVTFDQAMQQVTNAATITFGAFDRGGGFSQALANFITDGANGFADLEQSAVETGIEIRSSFEGLANAFDPLLDGARAVFGEIGSEARSLSQQISISLGEIDAFTRLLSTSFKPNIRGPWYNPSIGGSIVQGGTNLQGRFDAAQAQSEFSRRGAIGEQFIRDMFRGFDVMGNRIAPAVTGGGGGGASSGGGSTRRRGPSAETLAARAERERLQAIREEGDKQRDLLALQDDIIAARAALAVAADDVARFELQQLSIEQAARLSQFNTERRLGELTQEEYDARAQALAQEMDLRRQLIERRRAEAEADEQAEAVSRARENASLEADALYARAAIADTLEERRFLEESALAIQQEIERSLLEQAIAEGRIADAAAARAALADRQGAEMEGLGRRNQGALGDYLDRTSDPRALAEEAAVREIERVRDGLAEGLAEQLGTKNQFVKDLFSIFLDQVIFRPLAQSLRDVGGEGGLFGAIFGAIGIPGFANGGSMRIGGRGGTDRNVLALNGAPIARVSRGETLNISPNARAAGGGAPVVNQTFVLDARYGITTPQLIEHVKRTAKVYAAEAGLRSYEQSMRDAPGAVQEQQRYGRR